MLSCNENGHAHVCTHELLSCVHARRHGQVPAGVDKLAIAHGPIPSHTRIRTHILLFPKHRLSSSGSDQVVLCFIFFRNLNM